MSELTGRVAVVTGGATGIGRATARLLAAEGAKVFVGDYDLVDDLAAEDRDLGIVLRRCDVRVEDDVRSLVDVAAKDSDRLDILINNAGVVLVKQITDVTEEEWDVVIDTNLKGAFLASKHAIRHMQRGTGGAIVNVASNAGILPRAHDPVYSISKQALVALTKSLALCHAPDSIRVNAVCPGPVQATRLMEADLMAAPDRAAAEAALITASPLARAYNRMIDPDEVARAVLYLVSDSAAMVTGTMIGIDGGKSLGIPPRQES